jgi:hypothetical protein
MRDTGLRTTLRLTIDDAAGMPVDGATPLGWIHFDERNVPDSEIHLSYSNALDLLHNSVGVVGDVDHMPLAERNLFLGRAMGRALAHEIGHYLLTSKVHTRRGLMKAVLTAAELFMPDAGGLRIDTDQRRLVAMRLQSEPLVAVR